MGYRRPQSVAALRGVKAEGGWGTVCTEYCSIHPSSDDEPFPSASLWDDGDVSALGLTAEAIHEHGALAGVELWHGGPGSSNFYSRETPLGPMGGPAGHHNQPVQTKAMDKQDIRNLKRWHLEAAVRAQRAGFDIIYVYAAHWYLLNHFLRPSNVRSDEYGGSVENRARLLKELIIETKEAVGDQCAVAVRLPVSTNGPDGNQNTEDPRAMFEFLGELPDLWDVTVQDYSMEMGTSRFIPEASLVDAMSWVKTVTTKPVVSVGRFTSPDTMLRMVKDGIVDLVGAARPSIADPFIPKKIDDGREDEIRECIGCNICYTGDQTGTPIRCTQNPSIGEEYRKGWHPESIAPKASDATVLVVGAGPSGLEAAVALGKRGYNVTIAEARRTLGGRAVTEAALPGLRQWARVAEWRENQISKLPNVEFYLESVVDKEQVLEFAPDKVVIATGASWRRDGVGRWHEKPIEGWDRPSVRSADDVLAGDLLEGPVVVYDDDHYYLGGVVAEKLRADGLDVTLVTPESEVSTWSRHTEDQHRIQERVMRAGIRVETAKSIKRIEDGCVEIECIYTEEVTTIAVKTVVMVTSRTPNDELFFDLEGEVDVERIGDCLAPGTIATAVYSGHKYARLFDGQEMVPVPFLRER